MWMVLKLNAVKEIQLRAFIIDGMFHEEIGNVDLFNVPM